MPGAPGLPGRPGPRGPSGAVEGFGASKRKVGSGGSVLVSAEKLRSVRDRLKAIAGAQREGRRRAGRTPR